MVLFSLPHQAEELELSNVGEPEQTWAQQYEIVPEVSYGDFSSPGLGKTGSGESGGREKEHLPLWRDEGPRQRG